MKSSFGTKRSQVQILSPRPLFETGCRKMSGFLLRSAQNRGQNRTADKSDATGHATLKVDWCTTLSGFFGRAGQKVPLEELDGLQRKESDIINQRERIDSAPRLFTRESPSDPPPYSNIDFATGTLPQQWTGTWCRLFVFLPAIFAKSVIGLLRTSSDINGWKASGKTYRTVILLLPPSRAIMSVGSRSCPE